MPVIMHTRKPWARSNVRAYEKSKSLSPNGDTSAVEVALTEVGGNFHDRDAVSVESCTVMIMRRLTTLGSSAWWTLVILGFAVVLVVGHWSVLLAGLIALAMLVFLVVMLKYRRAGLSVGGIGMSTECEKCGALLQESVGTPSSICSACGHHQSWSRSPAE
jgi:hypothetical protein